MGGVLRPLGCFGGTLLAILVVLGVTETLKYVGPIERVIGLASAVLASAGVAYLREKWLAGRQRTGNRSLLDETEVLEAIRRAEPRDPVAPGLLHQPPRVDPTARPVTLSGPPAGQPPRRDPPRGHSDDPILAARRQAILFRGIVPPNYDPRHLSFFGGVPIGPSGLRWPSTVDRRGVSKPITFLMQIDCGAIPAAGRLGLMPDHGVLYFFMDTGANAASVSYEPGPPNNWAELPVPETLGPVYESTWEWPASYARSQRVLPKWPFDPVLAEGGPLPRDEEALEATYAWPGTVDIEAAVRTIPGAIVPHKRFCDDLFGPDGQPRRPFDTYPQDWGAILIATGLLAKRMKFDATGVRKRRFKDLTDEEFAGMMDSMEAERRRWEERASASSLVEPVPKDEGDRFWAWLVEVAWLSRSVLQDAATLSVEASLGAGAVPGARIPADAIERIRHRHALAVEVERGLHINIPDRMLAAPVDVQGTIDERVREFLLLLELSSNDGLAHYFGEGVFQLWIRPADLGARRFDRVELSSTAY